VDDKPYSGFLENLSIPNPRLFSQLPYFLQNTFYSPTLELDFVIFSNLLTLLLVLYQLGQTNDHNFLSAFYGHHLYLDISIAMAIPSPH
jgi:hypothetical protein